MPQVGGACHSSTGDAIDCRAGRVVVLVHRDELVRQTIDRLQLADPTAEVGVAKAERRARIESDDSIFSRGKLSLAPEGSAPYIPASFYNERAFSYASSQRDQNEEIGREAAESE